MDGNGLPLTEDNWAAIRYFYICQHAAGNPVTLAQVAQTFCVGVRTVEIRSSAEGWDTQAKLAAGIGRGVREDTALVVAPMVNEAVQEELRSGPLGQALVDRAEAVVHEEIAKQMDPVQRMLTTHLGELAEFRETYKTAFAFFGEAIPRSLAEAEAVGWKPRETVALGRLLVKILETIQRQERLAEGLPTSHHGTHVTGQVDHHIGVSEVADSLKNNSVLGLLSGLRQQGLNVDNDVIEAEFVDG